MYNSTDTDRVRTYHTCSELQYPTPRHPSSPSGLSPTASCQERPSGIALLCSTIDCLAAWMDHFTVYIIPSIDVAARRCLREALLVVDEEGSRARPEAAMHGAVARTGAARASGLSLAYIRVYEFIRLIYEYTSIPVYLCSS